MKFEKNFFVANGFILGFLGILDMIFASSNITDARLLGATVSVLGFVIALRELWK